MSPKTAELAALGDFLRTEEAVKARIRTKANGAALVELATPALREIADALTAANQAYAGKVRADHYGNGLRLVVTRDRNRKVRVEVGEVRGVLAARGYIESSSHLEPLCEAQIPAGDVTPDAVRAAAVKALKAALAYAWRVEGEYQRRVAEGKP